MITKWYPNSDDPQLGVFIQKHARTISRTNKITVLYAHGIENTSPIYKIEKQNELSLTEIIVYFRKNTGYFSKSINGWRYFRSIMKAFRMTTIDSEKFDVIQSYILLRTAIIGKLLSIKLKIPMVISEQWSGYATGKYEAFSSLKKWVTRRLCNGSAGLSMVSLFLSKQMHEHKITNTNVAIIPNVIEKTFTPINSMHTTTNVLLVADLVDEIKNISSVIRAVAKVKQKHSNFVLKIIGHGRDKELLIKLAESLDVLNTFVVFEGLKTNEEVYEYLKRCDFLVMNSRFETFSLICVEAMSCGKPVLATRCGGPEEFLTEETGIMIDVDREDQLTTNLELMLKHYHDFDTGKIMHAVESKFSEKTVGEEFNLFFRNALSVQD